MLYLVFGHTAEEPPLRLGPMASFRVRGAEIVDHAGRVIARHNGRRWSAGGRDYYRVDCAGPVYLNVDGTSARGPFDHFSVVNGTVYASRDLFAHYSEQDGAWRLHMSGERLGMLLVTPP